MTKHKIHRNSTNHLTNLPGHILEEVNRMLLSKLGDGGKTYNEIAKWLADQGYKTSDTALGRYRLKFLSENPQGLKKADKEILKKMDTILNGFINEMISVLENQNAFLSESIERFKKIQKDNHG